MSAGGIAKGRKPIPRLKSPEEESAFWDAHSFLDFGDWELVSLDDVCKEAASRDEPKLPVTVQLGKDVIRKLKDAAHRRGIDYQVLAGEILRRSLLVAAK